MAFLASTKKTAAMNAFSSLTVTSEEIIPTFLPNNAQSPRTNIFKIAVGEADFEFCESFQATALVSQLATHIGELSIDRGFQYTIIGKPRISAYGNWWYAKSALQEGWVHASYLEMNQTTAIHDEACFSESESVLASSLSYEQLRSFATFQSFGGDSISMASAWSPRLSDFDCDSFTEVFTPELSTGALKRSDSFDGSVLPDSPHLEITIFTRCGSSNMESLTSVPSFGY